MLVYGKYEFFVMQMLYVVYIQWQLSMLVDDARGDHMEEAYSRTGLMTAL